MKTLFKPLLVLAVTAIAFTSCMKDDSADREAAQRQQEEAIAASLASDELKIEAYLAANPSEGWRSEERRVGKECAAGWPPCPSTKEKGVPRGDGRNAPAHR